MFSNPFYNLHSSYHDPSDSYRALAQRQALAQQAMQQQQRAQRRAQRSQYLPDEDDSDISDSEHDWVYRDALQRQRDYERRQEEQTLLEEQRLQQEMSDQIAMEQEERRRDESRKAHRQRQAEQRPHRPTHSHSRPHKNQSPSHVPIEIPKAHHEPASPQRSPSLPSEPIQSMHSLEVQNESATKIQTAFRVHHALSTLKSLETEFDAVRTSFSLPQTIDFQTPEGIVTVSGSYELPTEAPNDLSAPKLAFDSTNYALHSYTESLNRLLLKLDGVESWGDPTVRKSRRRIVGKVELEASRIDTFWKQAWMAHVAANQTLESLSN